MPYVLIFYWKPFYCISTNIAYINVYGSEEHKTLSVILQDMPQHIFLALWPLKTECWSWNNTTPYSERKCSIAESIPIYKTLVSSHANLFCLTVWSNIQNAPISIFISWLISLLLLWNPLSKPHLVYENRQHNQSKSWPNKITQTPFTHAWKILC